MDWVSAVQPRFIKGEKEKQLLCEFLTCFVRREHKTLQTIRIDPGFLRISSRSHSRQQYTVLDTPLVCGWACTCVWPRTAGMWLQWVGPVQCVYIFLSPFAFRGKRGINSKQHENVLEVFSQIPWNQQMLGSRDSKYPELSICCRFFGFLIWAAHTLRTKAADTVHVVVIRAAAWGWGRAVLKWVTRCARFVSREKICWSDTGIRSSTHEKRSHTLMGHIFRIVTRRIVWAMGLAWWLEMD